MAEVYEASPVKRGRRTNAELGVIDDAIIAAVQAERPVSVRGVFYRVEAAGVIEKTLAAYDLIGRELLKLRRWAAVVLGHRGRHPHRVPPENLRRH